MDGQRSRARFTLPATALALALASGTIAMAATEPVDWKLRINVRPLVPGAQPTIEDHVRVWLHGTSRPHGFGLTRFDVLVIGTTIQLRGHRRPVDANPLPFDWDHEILLPPLPLSADCCQLEVYDEGLRIHSQLLEIQPPLHGLVFVLREPQPNPYTTPVVVATARLTDPLLGPPRDVSAAQTTPNSGYFWFFDPDNVEVTLKVLDGRPVNGHLWLFLTGMTNLGLTVTVKQTYPCPVGGCAAKTYVNPPGQRFNVIDVESF